MVKDDDQPRGDRVDDERWFGGRRWTGYFAVGFVVVLLLCVAILVLVHRGSAAADGQAVANQSAAPVSGAAATSTSGAGVAVTTAVPTRNAPAGPIPTQGAPDVVLPTSAPTGTSWQLVAGQAIPSEPGVGPAHVNGYTASGYAHTPLGALYAAANDFYRVPIAVSADTEWETPLKVMVAPGPGLNVLKALRQSMSPQPVGTDGAGINQIAGFKYVSYTATDAVVQLVLKDKNGGLHVGTIPVQWLSGDWRLVMTADGTIGGADTVVDSLSGYLAWQGVS